MKKIILSVATLAAFGFAGQASATANCAGSTTATSVAVTAGTSFIKQSFSNKCSANVFLSYEEAATDIAVCAGSAKGNFRFGGSSTSGSVSPTGTKGVAATANNTAATITAGGCSAPT